MNFNDALEKATQLAQARLPGLKEHVFLVRDLHGRIRLLLGKRRQPASEFYPHIQALIADITQALGTYAYPANDLIMYREDLKSIQLPEDGASAVLAEDGAYKVCLHDRLLMGAEWMASPTGAPAIKRFTLFSMKGGVGRSTTATILGWHLAKKGKKVLVFDLDLESPGVGATLLGSSLPRFGIVDWFVEDALGEGDRVLPDMVAVSDLGVATEGKLSVVPCFGTDTGDFLPKLGRAYLERGPGGHEPWPHRLQRLVAAIEAQEKPDIVLLDSRTGLHDTSASLILAMGADTLMFAVDSRQTWTAYRFLFEHWRSHPNVRDFRQKLWVIGSMVPRKDTDTYVEGLRDSAWDLFRATLYDQPADDTENPSATADVFNFQSTDDAGNHHPRPVLWDEGLVAFDPLSAWQEGPVIAAYSSLFDWFDRTFLPEEAP